ncbi:MAG: glycosyltransferase family 4 protein [Chloroflexi bacterium]|nr:glycosyltransferase family 4 protein [Chloroflexota bacterium]
MNQPAVPVVPAAVIWQAALRIDLVTTFGISAKYRGFPEYQQATGLARAGQRVRAVTYAEAAGEWGGGRREVIDGIDVLRLPHRGWWAPALARAIATDRPDLVHVHHWSNQFAYTARLACRALGIPFVVTPHGLLHDRFLVDDRDRPYETPLDWTRLARRAGDLPRLALRTRAPRRALRNYLTHQPLMSADLVIALSQAEARLLHDLGLPPTRVRVIPNGIDLDFATVPDADAWRDRWPRPVVLFIGQLKERKGWDLLLRAVPSVAARHPTASFVVVTHSVTPPLAFTHLVRELGIGARVHLLHRVDDVDKARLYRAADVVCLPTRYEGFGLPVVEAMAAGTPVVVTRLPVIDELVTDDYDGVLVPYNDPQALARTLAELLADPGRRQRLAANGRVTVRRYATDRIVASLLDAYHDVLGGFRRQKVHR